MRVFEEEMICKESISETIIPKGPAISTGRNQCVDKPVKNIVKISDEFLKIGESRPKFSFKFEKIARIAVLRRRISSICHRAHIGVVVECTGAASKVVSSNLHSII